MSSNTFGENFRITTFGESHGPALGVVIDGVRPGLALEVAELQREIDRRRPGYSSLSSPRKESDRIEVLSGIFEGKTTGAPIAFLFRNEDTRAEDYRPIKDLFRPGHADLTWFRKFGIRDWRGGGRTSGRETVSRVAAGAVAKQLLAAEGVQVIGHVTRVGSIPAASFDVEEIERNEVRCADAAAAARMAELIREARAAGDSVGGVVEVIATGVPAGWGDPVFMKLDAMLGAAMLSIGGVKGVEIGEGFALTTMRGSVANDPIGPEGPQTNRAGGILGGISTGAPVVARLAVKPTSSIRHPQQTIDAEGNPATIRVPGRHDPCLCPRIVPVAEAMMAIVLADAALRQNALTEAPMTLEQIEAEIAFCDSEMERLAARKQEWEGKRGGAGG